MEIEKNDFSRRIIILSALFLAGFLLLLLKLYGEQIRKGESHREKISRQSIRRIRIPARRGNIYTSDLQLLAGNRGLIQLLFYPAEMRVSSKRSETISHIVDAAAAISHAIERPTPLTRENVTEHLWRPGLPMVVFDDLTPEEAARAQEASRNYRGVELAENDCRIYPQGTMAAHLIGYVQPDSPRLAQDRNDFYYYVPDLVGKAGLEKAFDRMPGNGEQAGLRGFPGYSLIQVDSRGFVHKTLIEKIEPYHGNHLITTLDSKAQKIAENLLRNEHAALVLLDAANGDILAAATAPSYDLGFFSPKIPKEYYSQLLNSPARPLLNRAFNGTYTPGSILKPLVALAFLNEGEDPAELIDCDGKTVIGDARIRCAARYGHGPLDLTGALAHSCNDYMIEKGIKLGQQKIFEVLKSARLGERTGVEIPDSAGIFPSERLKKERYTFGWNSYDTGLLSIGQGLITLTPLQAAQYTAAIANGGTIYKPHLALKMVDSLGNTLYERQPQITGRLRTTPENLEIVRKGMFEVVHSDGGSGKEAFIDGMEIYGKTGSAEVGSKLNRTVITWFVCYFSLNGRTLAMAVMVEDGRSGGKTCAPLARRFILSYLAETKKI